MYTYVRSYVISRELGAQWQNAMLGDTLVYTIFNQFSRVVHAVTHPVYDHELYIDFTALQVDHMSFNGTLLEWFTSIEDLTLPMLDGPPQNEVDYIRYSDIFRAGYTVMLDRMGQATPDNFPREEILDLKLTRPQSSTDITLVHTKALITVNGFLHLTDTDGTNLWVKDGAISMHRTGKNKMGIISFSKLADLKKIPIQEDMIFPEVENRPLYERMDILLDEDIGNRTPLVSIGGYLFLPEAGVCWQSGERTISICLARTPYVDRYHESRPYFDYESLGLTVDPTNEAAVSIDELISDPVIKKYSTLSQSFVILVDHPNIFFRRIYVRHSTFPGIFMTKQDPVYPQVSGLGRLVEYWKQKRGDRYLITNTEGIVNNTVMSYRAWYDQNTVTDHRVPGQTYYHDRGYFLEIGGYR